MKYDSLKQMSECVCVCVKVFILNAYKWSNVTLDLLFVSTYVLHLSFITLEVWCTYYALDNHLNGLDSIASSIAEYAVNEHPKINKKLIPIAVN